METCMKSFSWSYSAYSSACICLACFEKSYILKEKQAGPPSADLEFGVAMHSAFNSIWSGEDGEAVFNLYWDTYAGKELTYSRFKYDELKEIGLKFISNFTRKYASRFELEKAEIRLYGEYKGTKLEGQYDFYGKLDGKLCLLDLKTSAYNYPVEKKLVALQLNLYAYLAIQNGYKVPEQLGYIVLSKGAGTIQAPLLWNFDEAKCLEFIDEMTTYCKMFETLKTYPRNPNAQRHNYDCYKENT